MTQHLRSLLIGASALSLAACGGGISHVASTPPPPVSPTPTPTPPPTPTPTPVPPPVPAGAIGLTGASSFKTYSAHGAPGGGLVADVDGVQFEYSPADSRYTVTLPGYQQGRLVTTGGNGSFQAGSNEWSHLESTTNSVTVGSTSDIQAVTLVLDWPSSSPYTYTNFARWFDANSASVVGDGVFAYGIPTAPGDVPITGSANYTGKISGLTSEGLDVWGGVSLAFNFGAGTLSGSMTPQIAPVWDAVSLGVYTFRDTVYSPGQTTFSGAFQLPGGLTGQSSFQGSFTGPSAAELMASWTAPYQLPGSSQPSSMAGVWIAKRP